MTKSKGAAPLLLKIFLQDGARVICRTGMKADESPDFVYIFNEEGLREAISKRLILRIVEKTASMEGGVDG